MTTNNYYITHNVAINRDTERELMHNDRPADARVALCAAEDDQGATYYYLQTNGDPVPLTDEINQVTEFLDTLGADASDVLDAITNDIAADSQSREWARTVLFDQITELNKAN